MVEEAFGPNGKDPALRAALNQYATVNEPTDRFRGIPFPGTFIVDRQGTVTSRYFEDYFWERTTTANILLQLGRSGAPVQATQAATDHLEVQTYTSDASVSLGTRFTIALEITPKRGIHIYAPGASNYRVIDLKIAPQPHVRTSAIRYPASEIYTFEPLNERVPVYRRPFKLLLDVVPEATAEARKALAGRTTLTVAGTLEYQACDDKVCFNPVSLPFTWTVAMHALVPGAPQPPAR